MDSKKQLSLNINEKYCLTALNEVQKDDIDSFFQNGKGVYICNFPEAQWYKIQGLEQGRNYSIEKKRRFFELMEDGSVLLSPTQDILNQTSTISCRCGKNIIHIGSWFTGRIAQMIMSLKIIFWLIKNRKCFNYCMIYNFGPVEIISACCAKLFGMDIVVDFEDDYYISKESVLYAVYFSIAKSIPDKVICINKNMESYFQCETKVFNGFINLSYMKETEFDFFEGITLLYSGTFDRIRGVDLIPDIVKSLRKKLNSFNIWITGTGPLEVVVKGWQYEEVEYFGFLDTESYLSTINKSDACLVLQKPDLPFSKGSFPSKVEYYSKFKKPILKIELRKDE